MFCIGLVCFENELLYQGITLCQILGSYGTIFFSMFLREDDKLTHAQYIVLGKICAFDMSNYKKM